MGLSRKEITFDLSQEALKRHYPRKETAQDPQFFKRAYKDIQRFMDANGFDRQQYSVYVNETFLMPLLKVRRISFSTSSAILSPVRCPQTSNLWNI